MVESYLRKISPLQSKKINIKSKDVLELSQTSPYHLFHQLFIVTLNSIDVQAPHDFVMFKLFESNNRKVDNSF